MSSSHSATIRVTFLLFAQVRLAAGVDRVELSVERTHVQTVRDALHALLRQHPEIEPHVASSRIAVGMDYAKLDQPIQDGDELSIIPPVQGG